MVSATRRAEENLGSLHIREAARFKHHIFLDIPSSNYSIDDKLSFLLDAMNGKGLSSRYKRVGLENIDPETMETLQGEEQQSQISLYRRKLGSGNNTLAVRCSPEGNSYSLMIVSSSRPGRELTRIFGNL